MSQENRNMGNGLATTFPTTNENLREDCKPDVNAAKSSGSSPGSAPNSTDRITPTQIAFHAEKTKSNLSLNDANKPAEAQPDLPGTPRNKKHQRSGSGRANSKLFADDFFIPILGDLFDDIKDQKLTPLEFCVLAILLRQVDFETGIWSGSAYRIQVGVGFQLNLRTIQAVMKSLPEKGVIKSFHRRGQRNDYQSAIDDYHVRFGRWEGYRLDAGATTDPKHPVYRTDCEATAQRQRNDYATTAQQVRNDRVPTAKPPRGDCVATLSPIAGNTPDTPEDIPELPGFRDKLERERTPTTATTTITAERPAKDARPERAVVDDDAAGELNTQQPGGNGPDASPDPGSSQGKPLDRNSLLVEIQRIFHRNDRTLNATDNHRERAFQMAQEHGSALFLAALDHWLMTTPGKAFYVNTGEDGSTPVAKTWLLHEFVETGIAPVFIETVRPFAHVARGEVLRFLLTINEDNPVQVTQQQVAALEQLIEEYDQDTMVEAYELADGMEDFVARGTEYIQQVKDNDDAYYVNGVAKTMGYAKSDDLKEHKATFSAAILKLAGRIGKYRVESVIRRGESSGRWKDRPLEDFLRFCEEAGDKAGEV